MRFDQTPFPQAILDGIAQCGYQQLTPVQEQVFPFALAGKDIIASAQTGTGKTAAFGLPILTKILALTGDQLNLAYGAQPQALVVVPTRELAIQVTEQLKRYAINTPLRVVAAYGGANFNPQRKAILAGVEVLVATPGRLFDHLSQPYLNLSQVNTFVLDEADRMLDLGFMKDIERIQKLLPASHQTFLFSATFPSEIKQLGQKMLNNPAKVELVNADDKQQQQIAQTVYLVNFIRKSELLAELIGRHNWQQSLVFVGSKESAEQVQKELLLDGIKAAIFHGDKTQGARNRALTQLVSGEARVLVATDVASRGLDLPDLPRVINFELPQQADDYIHRIGRTGRAGKSGEAISLVSPAEMQKLAEVEALLGYTLAREIIAGYEKEAPLPERYTQINPVKKGPFRRKNKRKKDRFKKGD